MYDDPSPVSGSVMEYGILDGIPTKLAECCEECHDELTMQQLRQMRDYFQNKLDSFQRNVEKDLTIEDFEKARKRDEDNDQEVGEEKIY